MPSRGDEDRPEPASEVLAGLRGPGPDPGPGRANVRAPARRLGRGRGQDRSARCRLPGRSGGERGGPDFQNLHRNKRSAVVDLKSGAGLEVFLRLGTAPTYRRKLPAQRQGPPPHRLRGALARNTGLVYASISGFGQDGPYRDRPVFDQVAQGMGGLMSVTGEPGRGPMRAGIPVADLAAGLLAAQGILLALLERAGRAGPVGHDLVAAGPGVPPRLPGGAVARGPRSARAGRQRPPHVDSDRGLHHLRRSDQHRQRRAGHVAAVESPPRRSRPRRTRVRRPGCPIGQSSGPQRDHRHPHPEAPVGRMDRRAQRRGHPLRGDQPVDEVFADPQVQHLRMARDVVSPNGDRSSSSASRSG